MLLKKLFLFIFVFFTCLQNISLAQSNNTNFIILSKSSGVTNIFELEQYLKRNKSKEFFIGYLEKKGLNCHTKSFLSKTSIRYVPIPYRLSSAAIQDLNGNQIDLAVLDTSSNDPNISLVVVFDPINMIDKCTE